MKQATILMAIAVVLLFSTAGLASAYTYQRVQVAENSYRAYSGEGPTPPAPEDIATMNFETPLYYPDFPVDLEENFLHALHVNQTCYFQFFDDFPGTQLVNRYIVLNNVQSMRAENRDANGNPITNDGKWCQLKFYYPGENKIQVIAKNLQPNTKYGIYYAWNDNGSQKWFNIMTLCSNFTTSSTGLWAGYKNLGLFCEPFDFWGIPAYGDWTITHKNNAYTHKLGARVWVVPTSYVNFMPDYYGEVGWINLSNIDKSKVYFEIDYVYLPHLHWHGDGDTFDGSNTLEFYSYYGHIYTSQDVFKLTPGAYNVIERHSYGFGDLPQWFYLRLRLDALWDLHSSG